jgi:hypothetical protein
MAFPAIYNFNYYNGDSYSFVVNPKQANGSPFDLNGFEDSGLFVISTARGASPVATGSVDINTAESQVTCYLSASAGASLTGNSYVYDIQISNSSASPELVYTLLTGNISVTQDVAQ